MKIRDIITESDVGDIATLSAKNVDSGYNAVSKLFSPSQWFKGNVDIDEPTPQKSKSKTATAKTATAKKPVLSSTLHLEKESVSAASEGKPLYKGDIEHIKSVYGKVKSGKISTNDPDTTLLALKTAINGKPLTDPQKQTLSKLSSQI